MGSRSPSPCSQYDVIHAYTSYYPYWHQYLLGYSLGKEPSAFRLMAGAYFITSLIGHPILVVFFLPPTIQFSRAQLTIISYVMLMSQIYAQANSYAPHKAVPTNYPQARVAGARRSAHPQATELRRALEPTVVCGHPHSQTSSLEHT